jgi:hypothetical protein
MRCRAAGASWQVATAKTVLENIATDIPTVCGANSPQAQEVVSDPHKATADFVGIGVHCAAGASLCSTANGGVTDALPDEPGGYSGYQALFGASTTDPQPPTWRRPSSAERRSRGAPPPSWRTAARC